MAHLNLEMRELRTPLAGAITYASGCGEAGRADWLNISRSGASLRLGRYLRPGRTIRLEPARWMAGAPSAIPAEIAWCAPVSGTLKFRAGLRILRGDPEVALFITTLCHGARVQNRTAANDVVNNAVWTSLAVREDAPPNAGVKQFTHAF